MMNNRFLRIFNYFAIGFLGIIFFITFQIFYELHSNTRQVLQIQSGIDHANLLAENIIEFSSGYNEIEDEQTVNEIESKTLGNLDSLRLLHSGNTVESLRIEEISRQMKTFWQIAHDNLGSTFKNEREEDLESLAAMIGNNADDLVNNEQLKLNLAVSKIQYQTRITPRTYLFLVFGALMVVMINFFSTTRMASRIKELNNNLLKQNSLLQTEVDERAKMQLLLTNVLNSSMNGIMAFEAVRNDKKRIVDFRLNVLNEVAANNINFSQEEVLGKNLSDFQPGNFETGLFETYARVVENNMPNRFKQYYDKDGIDGWFDISVVPNGDGIVITFSDVTEQERINRNLVEYQIQLEKTNDELEQFVYIASHDLQEPLRKVRSFGDRVVKLIDDADDPRIVDYVKRMQNASARMQHLIEDLLLFSRLKRSEINHEDVDLNDVLKIVEDILEVEIRLKNAQIKSDVLPAIKGSQSQLIQLFQNLLSNSLKYSKEDITPEVYISLISEDFQDPSIKSEDFWLIQVKDNGIGFEQKYATKIFQIFERLHGRTKYSGTGIGLAICERIVQNHGGIIRAKSSPDNGAEFNIYLPKK